MVGHLNGSLPTSLARHLLGQRVKEGNLVHRPRVHEEEVRVPELDTTNGGSEEHVLLAVNSNGHDPIAELREECTEAKQEGLTARGALRADDEVSPLEELLDSGGVGGAVAAEGDGRDGGKEAGELADAVGDAGDLFL